MRQSVVRWVRRGSVGSLVLWLCVGTAAAHRVTGTRFDAPLPLALLFAGAGITVAVTAGWLALPSSDPPTRWGRALFELPAATVDRLRVVARIGFLLLFVGAIAAGVAGPQVPTSNFAVVFVWAVWLKGVGLVAAVFGSPWQTLSPWRTLYNGLCAVEGDELAVVGEYPRWLGAWPALVGFLFGVGIVENLTIIPRSPAATAGLLAVYTGAMVLGAVAFGPAWFGRADALKVLYGLFGRVAPLQIQQHGNRVVLSLRTPWEACTRPTRGVALVGFVIATVYTVSFDGFANTPEYQTLLFAVRDVLAIGPTTSVGLYLVGFALFCVSFVAVVALSERLGRSERDRGSVGTAVRAFAPTVLPIAVAYEIAHNYPYVVRNLERILTLVFDALVQSSPEVALLAWLPLTAFWASQVVLVVGGHVIAVVASHHVSLSRYGPNRRAIRAHVPLTALMVGYTILSLWIVSRPLVA